MMGRYIQRGKRGRVWRCYIEGLYITWVILHNIDDALNGYVWACRWIVARAYKARYTERVCWWVGWV